VEDSCYTSAVREDFDRIADLSEAEGWDHNVHYRAFLLGQLPPRPLEGIGVSDIFLSLLLARPPL
jgi:hypothetical protein